MPEFPDESISPSDAGDAGDGATPPAGGSPSPADADALAGRIVRYLDGQSSADEVTALGATLHADPAARDLFVRMCLLESRLVEKFAPGRRELVSDLVLDDVADAAAGGDSRTQALTMPAITGGRTGVAGQVGDEDDDDAGVVANGGTPPEWRPRMVVPARHPRRWAAAGLAAAVLVGVGTWAWVGRTGREGETALVEPTTRVAPAPVPPPVVATVGGSVGVEWDGPALTVGTEVRAGTAVALRAGLLELRFADGATVVLQGPGRATPDGRGSVALAAGRLTALVPPPAHGFAVRTPTADVVDRGTEFGVGTSGTAGGVDGRTDVMVFEGRVELARAGDGTGGDTGGAATTRPAAPPAPARSLWAGEAATVDAGGTVAAARAEPLAFVRVAELNARLRAGSGLAYDRWAAYRYALARDPDVVAYYPFEAGDDVGGAAGTLSNASVAGRALDGVADGDDGARPRWVPGRWPQKRALWFARAGNPRVLLPPAAADSPIAASAGTNVGPAATGATATGPFTVAAWVMARSDAPSGRAAIVARGRAYAEQFALETEAGDCRAWVRQQPASGQAPGEVAGPKLAADRWRHVALAYDPAGPTLSLYLDGALVKANPAPPTVWRPADPVTVGCRAAAADGYLPSFDGGVDELVFLRRSLSAAEVRRMYEAGRPDGLTSGGADPASRGRRGVVSRG